jgi:hypothetical protein
LEGQGAWESSHAGVSKTQNLKGVGSEQRRALKVERVHRFSQELCQRTKGPVFLFKGFQQEPEEPFWLINLNDPEIGRLVDPAKVGGLHHMFLKVL